MPQVLHLGPKDDGYKLSLEEFLAADYREGYCYELVAGRLAVSPFPNLSHARLVTFVWQTLWKYQDRYSEAIDYLASKAMIFVPSALRKTCLAPDLAAYHDFPSRREGESWEDASPLLVAEVLSLDNPEKDLIRNAALYLRVPSIKEYWVVDGVTDPNRPSLKVHRRWGQKWRIIDVPFGGTYTTRLLPGFELVMNPFAA